jgi:dATP pyrophosphohydrolase
MSRAPFQVLVLPYRIGRNGALEYALLRRSDLDVWQGIAGGGEDDETPDAAARREATEEAGLPIDAPLLPLDATGSIPAHHFAAATEWGASVVSIPEYAFGIDAGASVISLSDEHGELAWLGFTDALERFEWESNRAALRELHRRLTTMDAPMIRYATSRDAASIAALGMQVWLHTYATEGISPIIAEYILEEFTAAKIASLIDDPGMSILVAGIDRNMVGYVLVHHDSTCDAADSTTEIATLYVQEHFVRRGIGTELLHAAQTEARRRTGSRRVWLTANVRNTNALRFYEREGFRYVGTEYFELGAERHENHVLEGPE